MFGCLQNFLLDVPKALVILLSTALGFKRKKITIAFPVFKRVLTFRVTNNHTGCWDEIRL